MKITLSLADAKVLLAAKLGIPVNSFDLEFQGDDDILAPILAAFAKVKSILDTGYKISAIKELRWLAPDYGLWEAKIVVENFDAALALAKRNKAWPMPVRNEAGLGGFVWKK